MGATIRDVDSRLLSRYFDDFVRRGLVPDVGSSGIASQPVADSRAVIEPSEALRNGLGELLGERVRVGRVSLAPLESEESIVAELTAWRSGGERRAGCFTPASRRSAATARRATSGCSSKPKSQDTQSIDVAVALAGLASPTLREQVHRFRDDLGLTRSHLRELAIYQLDDAGIRAHTPRPVLIERDDSRRRWVVVLESIADVVMINANDPARWDDESIDAALTGLASIHSAVARPNVGADAAAVAGTARRKQVDRDGAAMARIGPACPYTIARVRRAAVAPNTR